MAHYRAGSTKTPIFVSSVLRRVLMASSIAVMALGPSACSLSEGMIGNLGAEREKTARLPIDGTVKNRAFAYATGAGSNATGNGDVAAHPKRVVYHGVAPYICSPSGFGQKSHCVLRASL